MEEAARLSQDAVVRLDWERLYAEHAGEISRFLIRLTGDREVASELTQDTFVRAIRTLGYDAEVTAIRAWLFKVARNLARDHRRRQRLLAFIPFTGREPGTVISGDPVRDLVHRALRALPFAQATALVLHYQVGLTRREIAATEGISEEAVKSRLSRGRDRFLEIYRRSEQEQ